MARCYHDQGLLLLLLLPLFTTSLRIVSWNLLAPLYARSHKYPWTSSEHLESWPYRQNLILEQLLDPAGNNPFYKPDVLCLQEVEISTTWSGGGLGQALKDAGYECILQNVTRGHPVTNAICILPPINCLAFESRSRALITVLETSSSSLLFLATVHLEAGLTEDVTRFCQLRSLLNRVQHQVDKFHHQLKSPPQVVMIGDLNMKSCNPLYHFLSTGEFPPSEATPTSTSRPQGANSLQRMHYYEPWWLKDKNKRAQRPVALLPLMDAYRDNDRLQRTYGGGSVLDYVWTTPSIAVQETYIHPLAEMTRPNGLVTPGAQPQPLISPSRSRTTQTSGHATLELKEDEFIEDWFLPNRRHPSDHLPIGATLKLLS